MRTRQMLLALLIAGSVIDDATAQSYPTRPITMISPFPAGGPNDAISRTMAESIRNSLGQPVVVENISGASGSIGAGRVARSAPDGYTILSAGWVSQVLNGAVYQLSYDVAKDFDPVALLTTEPLLIVGKASLPAKTLQELIAWLKANPGQALQGTAGPGSVSHVAGVLFQHETGTSFQFVPYRGAAQILPDLVAGRIDMRIDLAASSLPFVRVGTIKAYAVMAKDRLAGEPDIPTVDEAGLPGMHFSNWQALWLPSRTPPNIIATLNVAVVHALADPAVIVLDEATSSLDPATEAAVERALAAVVEGRTVVTIAHRLSTAERADRVAVMEHGHLVEVASHDELVEQGERYARLWASWQAGLAAPAVP